MKISNDDRTRSLAAEAGARGLISVELANKLRAPTIEPADLEWGQHELAAALDAALHAPPPVIVSGPTKNNPGNGARREQALGQRRLDLGIMEELKASIENELADAKQSWHGSNAPQVNGLARSIRSLQGDIGSKTE
jgi:hypothetical protein